MSKFEFLMMVAAVVIALAISEIVGGWGRLLRAERGSVQFDWLHLGQSIVIAMAGFQYWVGMWAYEPVEINYGFQAALLILPSFFFVVSAYAISPDPALLKNRSCRDYYMAKRPEIFLPPVASGFLSVLADGGIAGFGRLNWQVWLVFGVSSCLLILLVVSRRVLVHATCLVLGVIQLSVFFLAQDLSIINSRLVE